MKIDIKQVDCLLIAMQHKCTLKLLNYAGRMKGHQLQFMSRMSEKFENCTFFYKTHTTSKKYPLQKNLFSMGTLL